MRRIIVLSILVVALLTIASLAGYNAYAFYLIGKSMRSSLETDAAHTRPVLELGAWADETTFAQALDVCRKSMLVRQDVRRDLQALRSPDLDHLRAQALRFLDAEDRVVEAKQNFLRSQLDLHCAEERFAGVVSGYSGQSGNLLASPEAISQGRHEVLEKAGAAGESARALLEAYREATEAEAKLRFLAEKAGIIIPPVFEPLEPDNLRQAKELIEAAGFRPEALQDLQMSKSGGTPRIGATLAFSN